MIKDTQLQAINPYITHVNSDGSNIGGVDPLSYQVTTIPGSKSKLLLSTAGNSDKTGKGYPAFLWSLKPRPILPNSGTFSMSYSFMLGGDLTGANVFETDTIFILNKTKYNLSLQRHIKSGQIDIGNWTDTTLRFAPLVVNKKYKIILNYVFNITTCAVVSYSEDGVVSVIKNGTQAAIPSNWSTGAIPQIQLGSVPSAQAWNVKIWDLEYRWF
jgi:hypothetical protein